jgi:hypothetical protein
MPVNLEEAKAGNAEEERAAERAADMVADVVARDARDTRDARDARDPPVVLMHRHRLRKHRLLNPSPNEVSSARSLRRPLTKRPRTLQRPLRRLKRRKPTQQRSLRPPLANTSTSTPRRLADAMAFTVSTVTVSTSPPRSLLNLPR